MKKVKVDLKINNFLLTTNGTKSENVIDFEYDSVKYKFDFDNLKLTRENEEFLSIISFKKEFSNYYYLLKDVNKKIINNLLIKELQIKENIVIIRYEIEEESFYFYLEYQYIV